MTNNKREILLNSIGIAIVVAFLSPVYWMVATAFKKQSEIFQVPPTLWPHQIDLSGFTAIFKDNVGLYFFNSTLISGACTIVVLLLAVPCAYGLARFNIRAKKSVILLFLVTQMLPATVVLTPLFILYNKLHLLNTYWSPILATATMGVPFSVLILRTFFIGIPKDLEEAASIDGCSRFRAFIKIILPISFPAILVCGAISFFFAWGDLIYSLTFNRSQDLWPLTAGINNAIGKYGIEWNNLMAFATVSITPVVIIFIILQKHLVKGLTSGAVK